MNCVDLAGKQQGSPQRFGRTVAPVAPRKPRERDAEKQHSLTTKARRHKGLGLRAAPAFAEAKPRLRAGRRAKKRFISLVVFVPSCLRAFVVKLSWFSLCLCASRLREARFGGRREAVVESCCFSVTYGMAAVAEPASNLLKTNDLLPCVGSFAHAVPRRAHAARGRRCDFCHRGPGPGGLGSPLPVVVARQSVLACPTTRGRPRRGAARERRPAGVTTTRATGGPVPAGRVASPRWEV